MPAQPEISNRSSMLYWWPRIKDLAIPQPKTVIVPVDVHALSRFWDQDIEPLKPFIPKLEAAAAEIGYPLFLRTDILSAKHEWENSCYLEYEQDLLHHVWALADANFSIFGPGPSALVFREYIPLTSRFTAFNGKMPVAPERRYFVRDGTVQCHHPYWILPEWRMAGIIQTTDFVNQFLAKVNSLGRQNGPSVKGWFPPAVVSQYGPTFNEFSRGNMLLKLNEDFGLTPLQSKIGQESCRHLGSFTARGRPIKQGLSARARRLDDLEGSSAKGRMKQIEGLSLDLLDLNHSRKSETLPDAPLFAHSFGTLSCDVNGETSITIKDSRKISQRYLIVFHEVHYTTIPGDGKAQAMVVCSFTPETPITNPSVPNWRELLAEMNREPGRQVLFLTGQAEQVGKALGGYWSADFALAADGRWLLIDCAEGEKSYHWEDCEHVRNE